ncbi:MAG: TetR/AcrR family transcriptional regulator [Dermatophilaceae bacterium]
MQVTARSRPDRSVTATARRAQIIATTTDVIAEVGYRQASFARIAERAGLSSTRLISYHFTDKDELVAAVASDVLESIGRFVGSRVAAQPSAKGMLRAYIESVVEFTASNRSRMTALLQLVLGGAFGYEADADQQAVGHVEAILRSGQARGEFRDFDPLVVATAVHRAVESLPFLLQGRPDLDCAAYARELVTLFDLGTRAATPHRPS